MTSAYCSEPCTHARCRTRSVRDEQEAELARHRIQNYGVSVGRITTDMLRAMAPDTRRIVFDAIIAVFCIRCGECREGGVCGCP